MENGPFEDVFPTNKWEVSIAILVFQRVDATNLSHPHPFLISYSYFYSTNDPI